jgi:hypothetical protein
MLTLWRELEGWSSGKQEDWTGMAHVLTYLKKLEAHSAFQVSPRGLLGGREDGLICLTKRYGLNNATSQFCAAADDDRIQLPVGSRPAWRTGEKQVYEWRLKLKCLEGANRNHPTRPQRKDRRHFGLPLCALNAWKLKLTYECANVNTRVTWNMCSQHGPTGWCCLRKHSPFFCNDDMQQIRIYRT